MRILIDTNIILDIVQKREPFFAYSYQALRKAVEADAECFISASAATDIFYMLRKSFHSAEKSKKTPSPAVFRQASEFFMLIRLNFFIRPLPFPQASSHALLPPLPVLLLRSPLQPHPRHRTPDFRQIPSHVPLQSAPRSRRRPD